MWLLGASAANTQRLYEAFGHGVQASSAVRFSTADLSDPGSVDLGRGLLRASACDLVVIDAQATALTAASWDLIRQLLVPGGLALVRHPESGFTRPAPGWTEVERDSLWAAPPVLPDDGPAPGPRWVIAGPGSLGELWAGPHGARRVAPQDLCRQDLGLEWIWSGEAQEEMRAAWCAGRARTPASRHPRGIPTSSA